MINYKLAKEIGATHHIDHLLYKFNDDGFAMCYFTEYGWEKTENDAAHMAALGKIDFSNLKPRTRTEYEKVTESIFDLRDEFERGELYWWYESDCKDKSEFVEIRSEYDLSTYFAKGNIFKRVEKEIDWHSELGSYLNKPSINGFDEELPTRVCIYLNGIEFHLTDGEYLESCRVALRANGEIEW